MKVLFKFDKNIPKNTRVIDTTSSSGEFRGLSPFVLPAPPAKNLENLWQFSKVYEEYWCDFPPAPSYNWYAWRDAGWADNTARRYPMGKGAIPICSWWNEKPLDYIEARKQIYAPEYAKNVVNTNSFYRLWGIYQDTNTNLILLDYDAYDHQALGMSLKDVINNPNKKCGHAFVLMMILTGELENCLE